MPEARAPLPPPAVLRSRIEAVLDAALPVEAREPSRLHAAMRHAVLGGGKRMRALLAYATGHACGAPLDALDDAAAAVELVHAYSLVHDDLPAMDDDALRRGKPTVHVAFDEATAILAGDALQTLAFQTIAEDTGLEAATRIALIAELARAAATPEGMVAGQALDMEGETRQVNGAQLEEIHRLKTGALIRAAARCGAIIGGANEDEIAAITSYGSHLGLLFQITDDFLDVTATAEDLGKTPGKDARSNKATYPALHGMEETRAAAIEAHRNACHALDQLDRTTDDLKKIADFILHRTG